ncbi:hypothetical protein AB0M29_14230 [Streptomyces sp. NPDC051976]|uniref:Rv1733c family protein n=1 Tax=Streptomyces sp. NPDC051976 TaxID=3154947 RepID=UPI00342ABD2C
MSDWEPHRRRYGGTLAGDLQTDANPLRRGADRVQAWTGRLLLLLAALLLPWAAFAAGSSAYHAAVHSSHAQAADRHPATATTTGRPDTMTGAPLVPVPVRITDPGHHPYAALTRVRPGTPVGTRLPVYVDNHSGRIVPPPHDARLQTAAMAVTSTALVGGLLVWAALRLLGVVVDRWRLVRWQREWRVVEPLWSAESHGRPDKGRS